jgi:nucleotide-binding universal stress UspA family protein
MRVLLAYDGSADAAQAAELIATATWPANSVIRVVSVLEPISLYVSFMPAEMLAEPSLESMIQHQLEADLAEVVARLKSAGLAAEGVILQGRPATAIAHDAADFRADLLVVGSRGHGALAGLILGSVSAELVDHAPCPVLVARRPTISRVVFATDGSHSAERAHDLVANWPIFDGAMIRVLSVVDVVPPWHTGIAPTMYRLALDAYARDIEEATVRHKSVADAAARRLSAARRRVRAAVRSGDAATEIVEDAATRQADLIVLGSRGETGLARLVLGSVARNVLQGTKVSVLIARDHQEAQSAG